MMRQFELVERVLAYNPNADEALLNKAYVYAMQKHGSQTRASGAPYFGHPLEVAGILTDLKLDDATIAVALLHDTIEDTDATRTEIDQTFGPEIGAIVEGLTKIERLNLVSREEAQAENLRKLLLAISKDVRVLLVKLADRLHNMRTLEFVPTEKRKRIAQETMDIYAPLAGRMGMQNIRSEFEDIAFRILQPDHYQAITDRLAAMDQENVRVVTAVAGELAERFEAENIRAEVFGRLKSPWSVFSKIERKSIALEQLSDVIGFRVLVESEEDCYRTLGVVHRTWKTVPGRFKDYISVPKYNDYRSLHTTIVGPDRQRVELQIRTHEMHDIAEHGIAAHALYKDDVSENLGRLESESSAYKWLRQTIDHLTNSNSTEEFLEYTKLELFQDQVFCFTPRGRLIALPRGATAIDLAYAVHTELGDTCVGSKVNGSQVPLVTPLRSGDEVEIIVDANHTPPANWESMAATGKARAAIRRAVRNTSNQRAAALGQQILDTMFGNAGMVLDEGDYQKLAEKLDLATYRDLLISVGEGRTETEAVLAEAAALKGHKPPPRRKIDPLLPDDADGWFSLQASGDFKFRVPGGQTVGKKGKQALSKLGFRTNVEVSPEGVVPGDRIVAILSAEGVITIYPIHSDALGELYDSDVAWLDVRWDIEGHEDQLYRITITMQALNKPGSLAQISSSIAACEANVHNLFMVMTSPEYHKLIFEIELRDLAQLNQVTATLKQTSNLSKVERASIRDATLIAQLDWTGHAWVKPEKETAQ